MRQVSLGQSGILVTPLAFGGNVFGWTIDEQQSFKLLDAFAAAGFNLIDTADTYSYWADGNTGGESEAIIGNWMASRGNRDKIVIATKVGGQTREHGKIISREYILKTVEESLKRLKTDYIDLYQTHWDDDVTPVEETLSAYDVLIKAGKVRAIGASNLSPARLKASLDAAAKDGLPKYQTFQPHYNLVERELFEKELEPIILENNMGVLNYYALASGFLTGKYRSEADLGKSVRGGSAKQYLNEKGLKVLAALDTVAAQHNTVPATVALAWLIARPSVSAPIASATSLEQLQPLLGSVQLTLHTDDIALLNEASDWKK